MKKRKPRVSAKIKKTFQKDLVNWYHRKKRDLPWRKKATPYTIAVAEFMCQQTQIPTVLPYYKKWLQKWPTWQSLSKAKEDQVLKHWEGLGYYRRARFLHQLAKAVVARPEKELPSDPAQLKKMPGIGPYIAGAIASIAFEKRAPLVDGNVERLLCRIFLIQRMISKGELEKLAKKLLPQKNFGDFNQALMECGSRICTPKNPKCSVCPLKKVCQARFDENLESIPIKKRNKSISEQEKLAWIQKKGKLWLELPKNPRRWKGFFRLPKFDSKMMKGGKILTAHSYSITKYRVSSEVVKANFRKKETENGKWFSELELEKVFLPAPHRKVIELVKKRGDFLGKFC